MLIGIQLSMDIQTVDSLDGGHRRDLAICGRGVHHFPVRVCLHSTRIPPLLRFSFRRE